MTLFSRANGIWAPERFRQTPRGLDPGLVTKTGMFYYPPTDRPGPDPKQDPHTTDRIAEEAVGFIEAHRDRPFLPTFRSSTSIRPSRRPADLVAKYEQKHWSAPADAWGQEGEPKSACAEPRHLRGHGRADGPRGRTRYLAIDRAGLSGRTIVIFTSDNGGLSTSEGHPTSNVPLRAGKGWPYEGGISVPLIIDAPNVTRAGSTCHTPVITTDFYPTLLDLTRLTAAPEQHIDGVSLVPLLKGGEIPRARFSGITPITATKGAHPVDSFATASGS